MSVARLFRIYVVPAAVFQSVMIGGGYGTGRELVEYFTRYGAYGGLLGIAAAGLGFSIVLALTYEFARRRALYDYRSFVGALIGRGWIAYEVLYIILFVIVLAVIGAAASEILADRFGIPREIGAIVMLIAVAILTFFGRTVVAQALTLWAIVLSAIFILYLTLIAKRDHAAIAQALSTGVVESGWLTSGLQYVLYSVALAPALLFSARAIETRSQAYAAGAIAAIAVMVPAALFHLSFSGHLPGIVQQPLPTYWLIDSLGSQWLATVYTVGLVGTFVQTGVGVIHGLVERVDAWRIEQHRRVLPPWARGTIALGSIAVSAMLSGVGIVALVARGYGTLAWGFLILYVVPLLIESLRRVHPSRPAPATAPESTDGQIHR